MNTGLLLIGHGTRDPAGGAEFLRLGELVRALQPALPCASGFLELAEPTIAEAIEQLLNQGVRRIIAAPLLLFAAGHAKVDVPAALAAALAAAPDVELRQLPALGMHPRLLWLSQRRLQEAVCLDHSGQQPRIVGESAADRLLVFIGRGSSDPTATAALREFAARCAGPARVASLLSCFAAMQQPDLPTALAAAVAAPQSTILVQPHLLFRGRLLDDIRSAVLTAAAACPQKQWRLASHLGPDPELAAVVVELVERELKSME